MTGKTAAAIASLFIALGSFGCLAFYEIGIETPIQAKFDVSSFQRVLVVGFLAGGSKGIDPNTETARLLRSQLRTKQDMKVVDSDAVSLVNEVDRRRQTAGGAPAAGGAVVGSGTPTATGAPSASDEPKIKDEKDLQSYESIFADVDYWKKLGEEYQGPLIVTGSVLFTEVQKSGMVSHPREYIDSLGHQQVEEVREFSDRKGYALAPKFIFIDGRTGAQLYSESFREETYYPSSQNMPALSSYFELMDKVLPSFLSALSTQKIKGTRILLK
jgi:hypothetical protein